jgi:hypothetical protein
MAWQAAWVIAAQGRPPSPKLATTSECWIAAVISARSLKVVAVYSGAEM